MRGLLFFALLAPFALLALACGTEDGETTRGEGEAAADSGEVARAAQRAGSEAAGGPERGGPDEPGGLDTAGGPEPSGGAAVPEIPILVPERPPELRTYRLLLVNPRPIRAVVYADAGADRVLLDTISRFDSSRVNVQVRAFRIRLMATDRFGERLGIVSLDLSPDSLNRWRVPAGPDRGSGGG